MCQGFLSKCSWGCVEIVRGQLELQTAWLRMGAVIMAWLEVASDATVPAETKQSWKDNAHSLIFNVRTKDPNQLVHFWKRYQSGEDQVQRAIESGNGYALRLADRYVELPGCL